VDPAETSDVGSDVPVTECVNTQFVWVWTYDLWLWNHIMDPVDV
jgi:hypothetical protein